MKKYFFSFLLIFAVTVAFAQTEKGKFMAGGHIANNRYNSDAKNYSSLGSTFRAGASAGYFITYNLAIGVNIYYHSTKHDLKGIYPYYDYRRSEQDHGWGISPFVRYYKGLSDKFCFFGSLSAGYRISKGEMWDVRPSETVSYSYKESRPYAMLSPGIVFFPSSKFGLEVTLGSLECGADKRNYDGTDYGGDEKQDEHGTSFNFSFGLQNLYLGAYFYL